MPTPGVSSWNCTPRSSISSAAAALKLIGPRLLGFCTHNAAQLRAAAGEPVDYLALGPVFATGSKENPDPVVGVENVAAWRGFTSRPLVAIGGITRANARSVLAAGADSLAVIGDLVPENGSAHALKGRLEEWLRIVQP